MRGAEGHAVPHQGQLLVLEVFLDSKVFSPHSASEEGGIILTIHML